MYTNAVSQLELMSTARKKSEEVSVLELADMDHDTDGEISEVEFLKYILVALEKVDGEALDILPRAVHNACRQHRNAFRKPCSRTRSPREARQHVSKALSTGYDEGITL